jgi:hypothetical protein
LEPLTDPSLVGAAVRTQTWLSRTCGATIGGSTLSTASSHGQRARVSPNVGCDFVRR